jgi:hypothetical protein
VSGGAVGVVATGYWLNVSSLKEFGEKVKEKMGVSQMKVDPDDVKDFLKEFSIEEEYVPSSEMAYMRNKLKDTFKFSN